MSSLNYLPGLKLCQSCDLWKKGSFVVAGEGPIPAKIMVVGEAPGADEDMQMRPFVGAAGQRLRELLRSADIDPQDVYFTNSAKHWPGPGNPKPKAKELRACRHWLEKEIVQVNPEIILLLGATAAENLLGEKANLKRNHGLGIPRNILGRERTVYVMYHPAAGLHNPLLHPIIDLDFQKLGSTLTSTPKITNKVVPGCIVGDGLYPKDNPVAVDIETTGLDVENCRIVCVSMATNTTESSVYLPPDGVPWLLIHFPFIVGHNILGFDRPILDRVFGSPSQQKVWDTMLSGAVLGKQPLGLKDRILREHKWVLSSFEKVSGGKKTAEDIPIDQLVPYAGMDACAALQLYLSDKEEIKRNGAEYILEIEHQLAPILLNMTRRGVPLNIAQLRAFGDDLDVELAEMTSSIFEQVGYHFNINSGDQLADVLFNKLGLQSRKMTKGKTRLSVDDSTLQNIQDQHPVISLLREYSTLTKLKGTYVDGMIKRIGKDGRIHTSFRQTGTVTGRLSSADPNLQNIPFRKKRGAALRYMFESPPGYKWARFDYSQIELRCAAALSKDKSMIQVFEEDRDIHLDTSYVIYPEWNTLPKDEQDRRRVLAKTINFGVLYGLSARGLVKYCAEADPPVVLTLQEAHMIIEKLFRGRPMLVKWLEDTKNHVIREGWVETILHRRRYFPEIKYAKGYALEDLLKGAINAPVQGTAADVVKLAMVRVVEKYPEFLALQVHDELDGFLPIDAAEAQTVDIAKIMREAAEDVLRLPVKVEYAVGNNWGEVH